MASYDSDSAILLPSLQPHPGQIIVYMFGADGRPLRYPNSFKRGTGEIIEQFLRNPPADVERIVVRSAESPFLLSFPLRNREGVAYMYQMRDVGGVYANPLDRLHPTHHHRIQQRAYASKNELVDIIRQAFPSIQATLLPGGAGAASYEGGRRKTRRHRKQKGVSAKRKYRTYR